MPALEISRSMLVNQGLSAYPALSGATVEIADSAGPAFVDVVGSFKKFVSDDAISLADQSISGIIEAFTTPLELATFFISAKYVELGGAGGFLGTTASSVVPTPNNVGFMRTYQHGSIYWHPQVGAHELHGPIRLRWQEFGGEKGFLGFPTSDVTLGADPRAEGLFAHFQGGSIYWAPLPQHVGTLVDTVTSSTISAGSLASANISFNQVALAAQPENAQSLIRAQQLISQVSGASTSTGVLVGTGVVPAQTGVSVGGRVGIGDIKTIFETSAGAFEVHGAIREKYLALGAEASILGYPRTDETGTPDGVGRFNHFQSGSIYWTPGTSAHEVHGLIRDRWASLGWERNPQLGYPITDELIPDPRIGHRRPEAWKKPIVSMPSDVIKLPADAAAAGFPRSVVNTPTAAAAMSTRVSTVVAHTSPATQPSSNLSGSVGRLSDKSAQPVATSPYAVVFQPGPSVAVDHGLISAIVSQTPASTPAAQRSVNRFADFENGMLFWFRGATNASTLTPIAATADGTSLLFSGADIASAAISKIGRAAFETVNAQLLSMAFVGTTGYSFDGVQVHNRRHKLQLILQGSETQTISGPFGISIPQVRAVTATVELQVEVWFDASQRRIALAPVDWTLTQASSGTYHDFVSSTLRARLDPLLWSSFELMTLPDTDGGVPIAVLSVKTLPNGAVAVFVEPHHNLVVGSIGNQVANAVAPAVVVFSPN